MEKLPVGSRINRYEIVECIRNTELIGFYKAYDTKLERFVFLKLVLHGASYSQDSIDYFLNEARSLAKLSHSNIVKVLDFGYDDENLYIINEYNEGRTLSEIIHTPLDWERAVKILLPIVKALSYAHSKGTIHRDLRPENILLTENDWPLLGDFSLIRIIENEETRDVTGTNVGLGSPAYISPEQGKGLPVDFRSDIYSLGVVFFEMVTGQKPFQANSSMEIVIQQVMKSPPRPSSLNPNLPHAIEKIILTAMAKDITKRYQSMDELADALQAVLSGEIIAPARSRRISFGWIALIAILVVGLTILGYSFWKAGQATPLPIATDTMISTPTRYPTIQSNLPATPTDTPEAGTGSPAITPTPSTRQLPEIPVVPGVKIPGSQVITRDNAASLVELARLGKPLINQMAFINHDEILIAATSAGLYYFDANTLDPRYLLDTGSWVVSFAISNDQRWIVTGDRAGKVAVWEILTGENVTSFEGGQGEIKALNISPDKTRIAFSMRDSIKLWDLNQNVLISEKRVSLGANQLSFLPGSDLFVTGGDNFQINLWDAQTGKLVRTIPASQKINGLSVSNDGKYAAVALENASVEVYDIQAGIRSNRFQDSKIVLPYTCITFLPNNLLIIAGSSDGSARSWNIFGDKTIWETPRSTSDGVLLQPGGIKTIAVSEDGTKVAIIGKDGVINLWDRSKNELLLGPKDLGYYPIERLAISPNGQVIAYQLEDRYVDIYALLGDRVIGRLNGKLPKGSPISTDSNKLLIEASGLDLYSLTIGEVKLLSTFPAVTGGGIVNFVLEDKIAAIARGRSIQVWSTSSGNKLDPYSSKNQDNCTVLNRWDGSFMAAASSTGILGLETNLAFFCKIPPNPQATSVKSLPDGSIVSFSVRNQTIEIWDSLSGQKYNIISKTQGNMLDVAISKDGTLLAAASSSGVIEIYDLATKELLNILDTHTSSVNQITFSDDQKYLVSGSDDGTVRLWGLYP